MIPNEYSLLEDISKTQEKNIDSHLDFKLVPRGVGPFREKYRPQKIEEIVPTCSTKQLRAVISQPKTSQVYLLEGITGTGKTTCARILAKAYVCQSSTDKPCLKCDFCISFEKSYDVSTINSANQNKIEDIRSLTEDFRYAPSVYPYKIYILDEVQRLTDAAQQVLLTELEEPPHYLLVFLCTTDSSQLLKPLVDRANRITFSELSTAHASAIIDQICQQEGIQMPDNKIEVIYQNAKGSIRALLNNLQSYAEGGFLNEDRNEDSAEVKDLYKCLVGKSWLELTAYLSKPSVKLNAENLRVGIENYFRGILLRSHSFDDAKKPALIMARLGGPCVGTPINQYNQFVIKCYNAFVISNQE